MIRVVLKALLFAAGCLAAVAIIGEFWPLFALLLVAIVLLAWRNPHNIGTHLGRWPALQRVPGFAPGGRRRLGLATAAYLLPAMLIGGPAVHHGPNVPTPRTAQQATTLPPPVSTSKAIVTTGSTAMSLAIDAQATALSVPSASTSVLSALAPQPEAVLYPFTIAKSEDVTVDSFRPRWTISAIILDQGDPKRMAATCAAIVRQALADHPISKVVSVFGFGSAAEVGRGSTRCRASGSVDGKGWVGDGKSFINFLPDQGDAIVDVGSALTGGAQLFRVEVSGRIVILPLAPTSTSAATPTPAATLTRYLDDVIKFDPKPSITVTQDGEKVAVLVGVTNSDSVPHTMDAQANLYRVSLTQLGDDPAQYLVSAGFTHLTLVAGEKRNIEIDAKNFTGIPIVAVDFSVTGE